MSVTLEQLLQSRDNRAQHQKDLLGAHPGKSLLCLTVQLPGPEKRNACSLAVARAGVEAIRAAFSAEYEELRDLETGYEAYFLVGLPPADAKRLACRIEDTHPLGRLMDIDVLSTFSAQNVDGMPNNPVASTKTAQIVDRAAMGLPPRRCLLCGNPARYCMRARTHTRQELLDKIEQMVTEYGI